MEKTIFEKMGGRYERQGDYLIPCLTVPPEEENPIGIWATALAVSERISQRYIYQSADKWQTERLPCGD